MTKENYTNTNDAKIQNGVPKLKDFIRNNVSYLKPTVV